MNVMKSLLIKRCIDISVALLGLVLLSPMLACLAGAIYISLGRPTLFCQRRPGLNGKPFILYKFRTMNDIHDVRSKLLPDSDRLSRFGKFLRRTSLDELPELWNVLKGEMSLIGPRPLLMQYLERYTPEQARRHEVKPGIAGWAQVNGRNAISWEDKFCFDVWYVDNWSLWLDVKILWMTLVKVIKREGINHPGSATMEKFQGIGGSRGG